MVRVLSIIVVILLLAPLAYSTMHVGFGVGMWHKGEGEYEGYIYPSLSILQADVDFFFRMGKFDWGIDGKFLKHGEFLQDESTIGIGLGIISRIYPIRGTYSTPFQPYLALGVDYLPLFSKQNDKWYANHMFNFTIGPGIGFDLKVIEPYVEIGYGGWYLPGDAYWLENGGSFRGQLHLMAGIRI